MKNKKYITLNGIEWEVGKFKKANKEQLKGAKKIKVKKLEGVTKIDSSLSKKYFKNWLR